MGRNVEFNVELLKDTKKFVKDFTVSSLPQTGSPMRKLSCIIRNGNDGSFYVY